MDKFFTDHIIPLGLGLILSIAPSAFKAGQIFERNTMNKISERIQEFHLEKLKQKTVAKLEMLSKHYKENDGNVTLPDGIRFKDIVELFVSVDETFDEKILGLNKRDLDLISNGTGSTYFVEILDTYGHLGGF